ncbi:MAG TPA: DNA mismatch repair endonuclease MutL [Armatimonadota bacterium]|nr:DNA mismatch repair endonuclease MutL [Armatimonadota bacterium]
MGRIAVLPEDVANKIAAGEVVERPASVVKELVENSLDAGATRVTVYLEDGGKSLIRVVDDGHGMPPDDAYLAVQPHATSKIASAADLAAIETLGFRGEALPSIASVSDFLMTTRPWDADLGTAVSIEGGRPPRVYEVGCAPGTTITVERLFCNVPARLKFMRTTATELARIVDLVGRLALAHPHIGFTVIHEGREVLRSDPSDDLLPKLADVLGRAVADEMIPIEHHTPLLAITGFVSRPTVTKATRAGHYLFVNRRTIRSAALSHAIEQGYGTLVPPQRHPVGVLMIAMDARLVDPNVHPTKAEVRFARESEVFRTVLASVMQALVEHDLAPEAAPQVAPELTLSSPAIASRPPTPKQLTATGLLLPSAPRAVPAPEEMGPFHEVLRQRIEADDAPIPPESTPAPSARADASQSDAGTSTMPAPGAPRVRLVGQALSSYVVAEIDGALCIIDQHAAHERVLFAQALDALMGRALPSQGLLVPLTLHLPAPEATALREHQALLEQLGFRVEPFGGNSVVVRSVPAALGRRSPHAVLTDMAEALSGQGEFGRLPDPRERAAASMACKAAVKADDPLTPEEMAALLRDLVAAPDHATCPHGRPTILRLPPEALARQFRRT